MHKFRNDYCEIAHDVVLKALIDNKDYQFSGYGLDEHSQNAAKLIKDLFKAPSADVHFLVGGTQTNLTFISYVLKDYEAVIAVKSGHINVHETGAIEATGHKVYTVDGVDGKLTASELEKAVKYHCDEHMVKPKLAYISNSTEIGTIYQKEELTSLYNKCHELGLYLFIDGARLACALTSDANNLALDDIAKNCDAFYLGGTKNGLMFGEALVIVNKELQADFRYQIKSKGAMLAKGFISGIQFEAILKDNLYFKIAKSANDMAKILYERLVSLNFDVDPVYTNQLFVTIKKDLAYKLIEAFGCELWKDLGDKLVIRFVTSFNTKAEDIEEVYNYLINIK
ncbi:MAG: aminotransferase class V-fold PLP-dependent enzyme [Bacilli bacterium]|nr:aminotransferase class V-fold PLP-dependent enzyme [Bacilli bacterium]